MGLKSVTRGRNEGETEGRESGMAESRHCDLNMPGMAARRGSLDFFFFFVMEVYIH
jgi:hypothetical protein